MESTRATRSRCTDTRTFSPPTGFNDAFRALAIAPITFSRFVESLKPTRTGQRLIRDCAKSARAAGLVPSLLGDSPSFHDRFTYVCRIYIRVYIYINIYICMYVCMYISPCLFLS